MSAAPTYQDTHPESSARYLMGYRLNRQSRQAIHAITGQQAPFSPQHYAQLHQSTHRILVKQNEAFLNHRQRLTSAVFRLKDRVKQLEVQLDSLSPDDDAQRQAIAEVRSVIAEARQLIHSSQLKIKAVVEHVDESHLKLLNHYQQSMGALVERMIQTIKSTCQDLQGTLGENDENVLFGEHAHTLEQLKKLCDERGIQDDALPVSWKQAEESLEHLMMIKSFLALKAATSLHPTNLKSSMKDLKKACKSFKSEAKQMHQKLSEIINEMAHDPDLATYQATLDGVLEGLELAEGNLCHIPERHETEAKTEASTTNTQQGSHGLRDYVEHALSHHQPSGEPDADQPLSSSALVGKSQTN